MIQNYSGSSRNLLDISGIEIGNRVEVISEELRYEGIVMPRYEYADDNHIVIKLSNGYNIGIALKRIKKINKLPEKEVSFLRTMKKPIINNDLPKVVIIGTGGTIASRIDYRTGGVHPQFSVSDIYESIPEISKYAQIETVELFNEFSENINSHHWTEVIKKIENLAKRRINGIVVAHGTDTMGYTSAALSFALSGIKIPVILVGSQRSSDRPSSDSSLNLLGAIITAAQAPISGVFVAMHSNINDNEVSIHLGTRVRKNHTSGRDAFESIGISPIAKVINSKVELVDKKFSSTDQNHSFRIRNIFSKNVALIKFHPNFNSEIIDYFVNSKYRGIIIEGTGLGHISRDCLDAISNAVKNNVIIGITSQCIWGRVNLKVYDTGRDLLIRGVIPLGDMISETAFVKMMWVLGNSKSYNQAKSLLKKNIAGEYCERSLIEVSGD